MQVGSKLGKFGSKMRIDQKTQTLSGLYNIYEAIYISIT